MAKNKIETAACALCGKKPIINYNGVKYRIFCNHSAGNNEISDWTFEAAAGRWNDRQKNKAQYKAKKTGGKK